MLSMDNANSPDGRKDAKAAAGARASDAGKPVDQPSIPPEKMSMQDAFAQVFKKMKAGVKMDLREPGDK
jgi:hypothetical protein